MEIQVGNYGPESLSRLDCDKLVRRLKAVQLFQEFTIYRCNLMDQGMAGEKAYREAARWIGSKLIAAEGGVEEEAEDGAFSDGKKLGNTEALARLRKAGLGKESNVAADNAWVHDVLSLARNGEWDQIPLDHIPGTGAVGVLENAMRDPGGFYDKHSRELMKGQNKDSTRRTAERDVRTHSERCQAILDACSSAEVVG
ncbi:hypothetical protein LCGC14_2577010 [marine sediment metagenome]|uniref:Uncharacterized protein n=1 Tax=marine sediment metagenome TaxID=412755 RepID=A0A0F9AFZ5_9ZZZZ